MNGLPVNGCRTRQERSFNERNQHFPRSADRAVHDPAAPLEAQGEATDHRVWITKDVPILRIDHVSNKGKLLGVWQAFSRGRLLDFEEITRRPFVPERFSIKEIKGMQNIKFVVKVNRGGTRAPEYVQRVDPTPIHMTTNRKLALVMGKFTAEDAIKSLQSSHCIPELESVQVSAG